MKTSIKKFTQIINHYYPDQSIKTIVELGARDCNETLIFHETFPKAHIYTFECNPATLPTCRERVKNIPEITLSEVAVSDTNGTISFYPTNPTETKTPHADGNPGASSLLKASGKYPLEQYVQDEVKVQTVRLDDFMNKNNIDQVDVLWMDIQGAELMALRGFGEKLSSIGLIHTEVEFFEIYKDQPLFKDIFAFCTSHGFIFNGFTNQGQYAGDAVFINKNKLSPSLRVLARIKQHALYSLFVVKNSFKTHDKNL